MLTNLTARRVTAWNDRRSIAVGAAKSLILLFGCSLFAMGAWYFIVWAFSIPGHFGGDYFLEADPVLQRVLRGGPVLGMYGSVLPAMMPLSLLVRLPVEAIGLSMHLIKLRVVPTNHALGVSYTIGVDAARYHLSTIAVWAVGLAATIATVAHQADRRTRIGAAVLAAALLLSPVTASALRWGHPEEYLSGAMVMVCILAAGRGRWMWAMVGAGLAFATKQPVWLIAPTIPFMMPSEVRWKGVAVAVAVAGVIIIPFIIPDISAVLRGQVGQVGASASSGHVTSIGFWYAFGLERYESLGRPAIIFVAIALPLLAAWRNQWRLSVAQAASVMAVVLLVRSAFDPLNVLYYATPAVAAMLALEFHLWQTGAHPLLKWRRARLLAGAPVLAFIGGALLAEVSGGFISAWLDNLNVTTYATSLVYMLFVTVMSGAMLAPVLSHEKFSLTGTRRKVYGGLGVLAVIAAVAVTALGTGISRGQAPPGPGYGAHAPSEVAGLSAPHTVYWLGGAPLGRRYLRTSAAAKSKKDLLLSMFDYDSSTTSTDDIEVITVNAVQPTYLAELIRECARHDHVQDCKNATVVKTPLGDGIVWELHRSPWEFRLPIGNETVYINSTAPVSAAATVKRLSQVPTN